MALKVVACCSTYYYILGQLITQQNSLCSCSSILLSDWSVGCKHENWIPNGNQTRCLLSTCYKKKAGSCFLSPRPHYTVFKQKRYCFVPDTATVHTTTPKTITENGSFLKRSPEWNDLKTVLFENAVFLVWIAKTMLSENDDVTTTTPPGCRPLNREQTR